MKLSDMSNEMLEKIADLSEARVYILEKDTLRGKEFEVHWDKELAMDVHNYWSTLNGYWANSTMPNCTCADFEGGFMAKPLYNDYYFNGEPCSLTWFKKWQESQSSQEENQDADK